MRVRAIFQSIVVLVGLVDASRPGHASEPGVDTDHIDAADDGGPRSLGILANGVATALGLVAIELDTAVSTHVALSVQFDAAMGDDQTVYGAAVGAVLFPLRFAFRGLYIHPRVELSGDTDPATPAVVSPAVTLGYEWVCPAGCTLRVGGGGAYGVALSDGAGGALSPLVGIRPVLDVGVGWLF
ncbi:MAG: hypothetical protein ABTD50_07010 [Polyangiaceae bacterium]